MDNEDRPLSYDYVKRNRQLWKAAGFMQSTSMVHKDDKELALAYIDVLRNERMLEFVETGKNEAIVKFVATRRLSRQHSFSDADAVNVELDKLRDRPLERRVRSIMHQATQCTRRARHASAILVAEPSNTAVEATIVANNNLASAYIRYAKALLERGSPHCGEEDGGEDG